MWFRKRRYIGQHRKPKEFRYVGNHALGIAGMSPALYAGNGRRARTSYFNGYPERKPRKPKTYSYYAGAAYIGNTGASDPACCGNCLVCAMPRIPCASEWTLPNNYEGYGATLRAKHYREAETRELTSWNGF